MVAACLDQLLGRRSLERGSVADGASSRSDGVVDDGPEVELFGRAPDHDLRTDSLAELVLLARKGERAAFGELYRRLAPMVAATAQRTVSDPETVADVVQETFVRALERLDQLREPSSVPAWLSGIARRVATDALRTRYRATVSGDEHLLDLRERGAGPDLFAEHRIRLHEVSLAIGLLSRSDAQMVSLVAELGLTTDELARALGVAPTAAKVRLHRARRRLSLLLEPVDARA
jgi:RNA polymerase sigma-70 factor (ECF subfamily)